MRTILTLTAAAFVLAACARSEPVDDSPTEEVDVVTPSADGLGDDQDQTTPGSWQPGMLGTTQSIAFQAPNGQLLLGIRCDVRDGLIVQRPGLVTRGNLALLQMRTGDTVRRLAVTTSAGSNPQIQATVPYNDQLLGALMRFSEPLEVRFEGLETLVLPPSPAVSDLVRECQSGGDREEAAPEANQAAPDETQPPAEPAPAEVQ